MSYEEIPIPGTLQQGRTPRADDTQAPNSNELSCQRPQGNSSFLQNYEQLRKCILFYLQTWICVAILEDSCRCLAKTQLGHPEKHVKTHHSVVIIVV